MKTEENIYRDLQKHLNKQAVGFPATKSGAEIRILKRFFSPEEARLALHLSYHPQPISSIYNSVKSGDISLTALENMLNRMVRNGAIGQLEKENEPYYFTMPFVVGMYEWQVNKLTPEFLDDVAEYASSKSFGLEFISTKLPQMRTIPVEQSIKIEHHVTTYDCLRELIESTDGSIGILECICRKAAAMKGNPCKKTSRSETCMVLGSWAKLAIEEGVARSISKAEALEIARQNEADGLVLQPSNDQKIEFICACCGCCCGILSMQKKLPKPVDFWSSNYYAVVNEESCSGCGDCVQRCQVDAAKIDEKTGICNINLRCIGCGNCVVSCPMEAISLIKKEKQVAPPKDSEELYKIIGENKPGTFGKIGLITKLMLKK
jgi:electron transport complex protein RnfB